MQYDKATFSVYPQVSCLITMLFIKNSHPLQLINIFGKQLVVLYNTVISVLLVTDDIVLTAVSTSNYSISILSSIFYP